MSKFKLMFLSQVIIFIFFYLVSINVYAAIPAFPGAQGGGAFSLGGRGGKVIEVTNLNDSGVGSFRAACEAKGPRIVIFRVAGVIDAYAGDRIYIKNPYITIAGQTAPGGGILIKRGGLMIRTHDVVVRYLKIRLGKNARDNRDCIGIGDGAYNVIVDHCSFSWATDENCNIWSGDVPVHNVTYSWNLIAEGLEPHSCGFLAGSNIDASNIVEVSLHHNLLMHNHNRAPLIKIGNVKIINNIVYDWSMFGIRLRGGVAADIIGNVIKAGPAIQSSLADIDVWVTPYPEIGGNPDMGPEGNPSIYIKNNLGINQSDPDGDNWNMIYWQDSDPYADSERASPDKSKCARLSPLVESTPSITIDKINSVADLEAIILNEVGAFRRLDEKGNWVNNSDSVDLRLVNEYLSGTGKIPTSEVEVGGYPTILLGAAVVDTDHDGMPDDWETVRGFNPADPSDGVLDADGDGYTNVEEYINASSKEVLSAPKSLSIKP